MKKLVAVGDNCMDVYSDGSFYPGGNPVNVAVYTKRLGNEASYVGVVGNDEYGEMMIDRINQKGVNISHLEIKEGNTAVTQVDLVNGDRVFGDYDEGVLEDFKLSPSQMNFILTHDVLISGLWGNVHHNFEKFKKQGLETAFDAADRPDDEVSKIVLPHVDYFFFSNDDIENKEELINKVKDIHRQGPKIVVAMLGEKGSLAYDGEKIYEYGIVPVDVVDTMGAGDSYIAGFLKGVIEGKDIQDCMALGASTASETIAYSGAWG